LKETLAQPVSYMLMAGLAIALLIPCFWQPHIEAGDLASHLYNAWLAGEIHKGTLPGLTLVHPVTNVLADWGLEALSNAFGPTRAARVMAAVAVQIFFWGAFSWITVVHRRYPWMITPFLAMLAYGLIFRFGFLNFYLSTGLTLCLMALLWPSRWGRFYIAIPLALLAFLAHPLPLIWGILALMYVAIAERLSGKMRVLLLPTALALLILIQTGLTALFPSRWSLAQLVDLRGILGLMGAGQFWIYGTKYLIIVAASLLLWSMLFLERVDQKSMSSDPIVHLWVLNIASFVLIPFGIQFPNYTFGLLFISERISFFVAILFCAVIGGCRYGRGMTRLSAVVAAAFFTFAYVDEKAMNLVQGQVAGLLAGLPPGQRVVVALQDTDSSRLNGLVHIGSGACIGYCFDYSNYEPATGQFRIRVAGPNPFVASTMTLVSEMESGHHIVTPLEAPLYSICPSTNPSQQFILRKLEAGEKTCLARIQATSQFF
jgi:hypothetical protein